MQPKKYTPHLALLGTNLAWAFAYPMYHMVLPNHITPLAILTATLIISALFSLVPLLWEPYERVARRDVLPLIGAALLVAVLRKGLLIFALSMTTPIDGSIISTLTPIIVLLISIIVGIEKFNLNKLTGLLLGLGGAVGVILTSSGGSDSGAIHLKTEMVGNIMVLGCAMISAIYIVWFKELLKRYSPTTVMRWVFCTAAIAVTPFGLKPLLETNFAAMPTHILLATIYVMVMPTYIPNLLQNYALQYVQPTVSSTFAYIQPIVAGAVSMALHLDTPKWESVLFAGVIFAGVAIVISSYKRSVV
ncbi:MAG: DMT family transporter [Rikenellaceae bacterium]